MIRIFTIIGARPQFIKAATVSRQIARSVGLIEHLVHTGQHYDANMSDVFFQELGIQQPAFNLGIAGGGHGAMSGRMLVALEELFIEQEPDIVLIYGDTNSTLAGALAATKLHIPVAHVEAGLRSFNKKMPEEINRIIADHCSDLLFTPTSLATSNLKNEGISGSNVVECGDVMYDAALHFSKIASEESAGPAKFGLETGKYVLATVHRQENTDDPKRLRAIIRGLAKAAAERPVVLPLHPRTRSRIDSEGLANELGAIRLIEPVGYLDMVGLEAGAALIATDSGGVQKEAFFHKVPCVTLRDETEWSELLESGWNRLTPPVSSQAIFDAVMEQHGTQGTDVAPYGSGNASEKIAIALKEYFA